MIRGTVAVATVALLAGCSHIVVLHDPLTAAEHNDLGVVYESQQRTALAEREYERALRKDPRFAIARVNLGNLAAREGRWKRAERCYRAALRDRPEDRDAMNNLAVALLRQGKELGEAESLAARAVRGGGADSTYRITLEEVRRARK